jgi:hypothetical protein
VLARALHEFGVSIALPITTPEKYAGRRPRVTCYLEVTVTHCSAPDTEWWVERPDRDYEWVGVAGAAIVRADIAQG